MDITYLLVGIDINPTHNSKHPLAKVEGKIVGYIQKLKTTKLSLDDILFGY